MVNGAEQLGPEVHAPGAGLSGRAGGKALRTLVRPRPMQRKFACEAPTGEGGSPNKSESGSTPCEERPIDASAAQRHAKCIT